MAKACKVIRNAFFGIAWVLIAWGPIGSWAQAPGPSVAQVPVPEARPTPGTYSNTTAITLVDALEGAEIHYTWDGSDPTASSPVFDPHGVLFFAGLYDGDRGLRSGYTLRAVATKQGMKASEVATFGYDIVRRNRTDYISEEVAPGVRMIRDADNDKMFLVCGSIRCALIDSGMGRGALRDYARQFSGSLPVVAIFTHSHGDHIGQADQFIADSEEFVGASDREAVATFLERRGVDPGLVARNLKAIADGATVDLGGHLLEIIAVPGHTPGSIVILDTATGNLFTGDSFGNNSPLPPDVMWMQRATEPLDSYYATVIAARARLGNRVTRIMTGHNDRPLVGTRYLDNVELALQRAMDEGNGALVPSWRPPGLQQIVVGDRFTDPDWFGVNVNAGNFLPAAPEKLASLVWLDLRGAQLAPRFSPAVHEYTARTTPGSRVSLAVRAASSRARRIELGGKPAIPGQYLPVPSAGKLGEVTVQVTSPDGTSAGTYRIKFTR